MTTQASSGDRLLAQNIRDVLTWDSRVDATNVVINVTSGVVTLSGTVRQLEEQSLAAGAAWSVKGVREVINNIAVSPTADRVDVEIAADLVRALTYHRQVDLRDVVVHVAGGVVILTGVVPTALQKRLAEARAWATPGVGAVENALDVLPDQPRPDDEIRADVQAAIVRDARIQDATHVDVAVDHGTVRLSGAIDTPAERQAAEEDAYFAAGVRGVSNDLRTSSPNSGSGSR